MSTTRVGRRLRAQVLADASGRCGYCQSSEEITGIPLEIEHLRPEALGGPTRRDNLWPACRQCNALTGDRVAGLDPETRVSAPLFNPRRQAWAEHFAWVKGGAHVVQRYRRTGLKWSALTPM